jgi:hypothetical protein
MEIFYREKMNDLLLTITILFVVALLLWISYTIYSYVSNYTVPVFTCTRGKCATNRNNGMKRCPANDIESIEYNPEFEVCNSKYSCETLATPFALLNDGSTSISGQCEDGVVCRCLDKNFCPSFSLAKFTSVGSGSRRYIQQSPLESQVSFNYGAITITDPSRESCGVYLADFDKVTPRTSQCNYFSPNNPDLNEARRCINSNPCSIGRLAFYPPSLSNFSFNSSSLYSTQVMCMPDINDHSTNLMNGEICRGGQVPVFDSSSGKIVCLDF